VKSGFDDPAAVYMGSLQHENYIEMILY